MKKGIQVHFSYLNFIEWESTMTFRRATCDIQKVAPTPRILADWCQRPPPLPPHQSLFSLLFFVWNTDRNVVRPVQSCFVFHRFVARSCICSLLPRVWSEITVLNSSHARFHLFIHAIIPWSLHKYIHCNLNRWILHSSVPSGISHSRRVGQT